MTREMNARASMFGCNSYCYMRSRSAGACLTKIADQGFGESEGMVRSGHPWQANLSTKFVHTQKVRKR